MEIYEIIDCTAVTLEGKGIDVAQNYKQNISRDILRPASLKGIAPKVDPCTGICVTATDILNEEFCHVFDKTRIGVIIGTKTGNQKMAKDYADKVRKGSVSSLMYSTSGYNMCAGITALSKGWKGPTVVFPDSKISYSDLISLSCNYLKKDDADIMIVGQVDTSDEWGLGIFSAISLSDKKSGLSGKVSFEIKSSSNQEISSDTCQANSFHNRYFNDAINIYNMIKDNKDSIVSRTKFGESILFRRQAD